MFLKKGVPMKLMSTENLFVKENIGNKKNLNVVYPIQKIIRVIGYKIK